MNYFLKPRTRLIGLRGWCENLITKWLNPQTDA